MHHRGTRHRHCTRHGTSRHHTRHHTRPTARCTWHTARSTQHSKRHGTRQGMAIGIESEFESNLECCNSNIWRLECWGNRVEGRSGARARKPADFKLPSSMQAHRAEKLMCIPPSINVFIHSHCSTSFWSRSCEMRMSLHRASI